MLALGRLANRIADPVGKRRWLDRMDVLVQEVERAVGDVELVDRIDDGTVRAGLLRLADPRRLLERRRRGAQRHVQVPSHLPPHREEQPDAQHGEHQHEHTGVPGRELQSQPRERLHQESLTSRSGTRRRAAS